MNILIADDSQEIRKRVKEILKQFPEVDIEEASSGQEAIEIYYKSKPDLVILDIQMPNGNGLAVLKMIKDEQINDTKAIMLTNYDELPYRKRCMQLGADFYVVKSSEFEQLPKIIEQVVRQHKDFRKKTAETSGADYIN